MPVCIVHICVHKNAVHTDLSGLWTPDCSSLEYLNFSQSPEQTRQVTEELLAPLGRVTGCPGQFSSWAGGRSSLPELLARGKAEVTVWSRVQAVGEAPWRAPGRLPEHSRGIIMGRECQQGQQSANYAVGFGRRSLWDYLLMQHYLYLTLVRHGKLLKLQ